MNKQQLRGYLLELQMKANEQGLAINVMKRHHELLVKADVNKTANGAVRFYLPKNASKKDIEDYLEQYINACYDCGVQL